MEPKELEKNLGDLEEKMDRVRALYEQYFAGVEKLEPQIPRKEVDRVIALIRKEQIRNTAARFKFQTLIQRYNTMQQHWGRILREIETGTFKRDLIRAAARFGVEDALTAAGKKHANRLRRAVENEQARRGKRPQSEEIYEELSASDYEVESDEDDAPTPPPQRAERPRVYDVYEEPVPGHAQLDRSGAPSFHLEDPLAGADSIPPPPGQSFAATAESPAFVPPAAKKKGGLRWGGGGGGRKADPEALKRIANLAGGDGAPPPGANEEPAPHSQPRKPLMSHPIDLGLPDDSVDEPKPAPAAARREATDARKPLLSAPLDLDLGLSPSEPPPPPPAAVAKPARKEPEEAAGEPAKKIELQRPRPQLRPPPTSDAGGRAPPSSRREFGDLNDQRLRELYGQYVEKRRERNESTAGITFEKLSDSLKNQADKLRSAHGKRVDYEIVVKDGKTLIKPIVK